MQVSVVHLTYYHDRYIYSTQYSCIHSAFEAFVWGTDVFRILFPSAPAIVTIAPAEAPCTAYEYKAAANHLYFHSCIQLQQSALRVRS